MNSQYVILLHNLLSCQFGYYVTSSSLRDSKSLSALIFLTATSRAADLSSKDLSFGLNSILSVEIRNTSGWSARACSNSDLTRPICNEVMKEART